MTDMNTATESEAREIVRQAAANLQRLTVEGEQPNAPPIFLPLTL